MQIIARRSFKFQGRQVQPGDVLRMGWSLRKMLEARGDVSVEFAEGEETELVFARHAKVGDETYGRGDPLPSGAQLNTGELLRLGVIEQRAKGEVYERETIPQSVIGSETDDSPKADDPQKPAGKRRKRGR